MLNLIKKGNFIAATDLWMVACMGLRRSDIFRIVFENRGKIVDLIKIEEHKNRNLTIRVVPDSLRNLINRYGVCYPLDMLRFKEIHEICLRKFGQFYGLRHSCITNTIITLMKSSKMSFHRNYQTTFDYYINKNNADLISNVFSLAEG